ncbi:TrmH family RNA methyltransferase [uncultured Fibrobacter sp.]|uniref:TrmH family RNA methyltransferase n=1 Tax=uncultured Fibrobacter sp. TaxID=261512 RepID=UPI0025964A5E|nr:TrmH family RNA methyltransferase [uncultured Fibrobacter sp.]
MTEENNSPKHVVRQTFTGKFGVSDDPADHGFGRRPEVPDPDAKETRSERRAYERSQERKSFGDRERKPFNRDGERSFDRGERRSFGDRERKPFNRDGERSFDRGERRSFGDRERKPFNRDGERSFDRGERRSFGDRERRPFNRDGERSFDRSERRSFGDRERRPFNRDGERSFGKDSRRPRRFGDNPFQEDDRPIFRQKPENKSIDDEEIVRDEDAVLNFADSPDILPESTGSNPPWFRRLLVLTTEKGREREGKFIAEGVRVVEEILANHLDLIIGIYVAGKRKVDENGEAILNSLGEETYEALANLQPTIEKARTAKVDIHVISEEQLKRLSSTVTTQGVVAVCRSASTKPNYEKSRSILTLVDAVQDPGNLGAIFRTSLGFNSSGIIIGKGSVNPFNPKFVRGSSCTILRVPFEKDRDLIEAINELHSFGYTIIATDLHGKQSLAEIEPRKLRKVAFLVGNEGAGTDQHLIDISDETVKIPMSSDLESLNVSVAHGILSYEMAKIQKDLA